MRNVLEATAQDYQNRIDSLTAQIETQNASIERMTRDRAELIEAKQLVDGQIKALPAPKPEKPEKAPANPRP